MNTRSGRGFDSRQVHKTRARGRNGVTPALHAGDDGFDSRVVHDLRKRCLAVHSLIHREQMLKATAKRLRISTQKRGKIWNNCGGETANAGRFHVFQFLSGKYTGKYRFESCSQSRYGACTEEGQCVKGIEQ